MIEPIGPSKRGLVETSTGSGLSRRWTDLMPRVLSALVMAILALGTAIAGGAWFSLFWLAASCAILWEWQHMIDETSAIRRLIVGVIALTAALAAASAGHDGVAVCLVVAGLLGVSAVAPAGLRLAAATGLVYASALLASVIVLRTSEPDGFVAIIWLFAVVWGTDIMAYFGGRRFGGPKLWPRLSPSKTWSGFFIGILCGTVAGLAVAPSPRQIVPLLLIGLAAAGVAQAGDLFESAMKRRYGVKDASHLIPGHGGVMDRLDGFVAAAVFAACLGIARLGIDAAGAGLFTW